nr:reverse transcriptase domain-containing protein [Tanacetum cinerariifolium]
MSSFWLANSHFQLILSLVDYESDSRAGIAKDVFVSVGKFTFLADFVIVDYESDPRVPLILGRPFLWTARALIDVHGEEMILCNGDERLTLNMRHDTSSYSNQPQKESINMINIYHVSSEDFLEELFTTNHQSGNPTFSHQKLTSPKVKDDVFDPEGGNVQIKKLLDLDSTKDPREKLLNINLLLAKIKFLNDNHTPDHVIKPLSSFIIPNEPGQGKLTSVVMKDNLVEPRVYMPNVLTTHPTLMLDLDFIPSDNSLPEYEIFYFDIEEKDSGSTTIHADISLLDLECFNFNDKPDPGELTSMVDSGIRENVLSATNVNLPPEEDHSPLFAYVGWIFLSFLTDWVKLSDPKQALRGSINPLYLSTFSFGVDAANELEEKHKVFNVAGEELCAAKQKLMLLD